MPNFTIVDNDAYDYANQKPLWETQLDKEGWVDTKEFKLRNRIIDENGNFVVKEYEGRLYQIIGEKERLFTPKERFKRGFIGVLVVICTLGLALFSNSVRQLFTQQKLTTLCATLVKKTEMERELYQNPIRIIIGQKLTFALIVDDHEINLRALKNEYGHYSAADESPIECLFHCAQENGYYTPEPAVSQILNHPSNTIDKKAFVDFLMEKEEGLFRMQKLTYENTLAILNIIKECAFPISNEVILKILDTQFYGRDRSSLDALLIEIAPNLVLTEQYTGHLMDRMNMPQLDEEHIKLLLEAKEARSVPLTEQETLVRKVLDNDCAYFNRKMFAQLPKRTQENIYYYANGFEKLELIHQLHTFGMKSLPYSRGVRLIDFNMNVIQARKAMEDSLKELRQNGVLITEEESKNLDLQNFTDQRNRGHGISMASKLFCLHKCINENGLKHVKAPKALAVISSESTTLSFSITMSHLMQTRDDKPLKTYIEKIGKDKIEQPMGGQDEKVDKRHLSLEEAIELLTLSLKTGYQLKEKDLHLAQDGVYLSPPQSDFVEHTGFGKVSFDTIIEHLAEKDHAPFLAAYNKQCQRDYEARAKDWVPEELEQNRNSKLNNLCNAYGNRKFTFSVDSL